MEDFDRVITGYELARGSNAPKSTSRRKTVEFDRAVALCRPSMTG